MVCPKCGGAHNVGARTCPRCGCPLPQNADMPHKATGVDPAAVVAQQAGPEQQEAAAKEAREAELMRQFDTVLEAEKTKRPGRKPATKAMGGIMAAMVLLMGGLGFFLRYKATNTVVHNTPTYQYETSAEPDSRFLAVYPQTEAGAGEAALRYASLKGISGLTQEYVLLYGNYADVWLRDAATGTRYDVTLSKSTTGQGWTVVTMKQM